MKADDDDRCGLFEDAESDDAADEQEAELRAVGGYTFIVIPPPVIGTIEKAIAAQLEEMVATGQPPRTSAERLYFAVLSKIATQRGKITSAALVVAVNLAMAKALGISVPTHPRALAEAVSCRYQRFLQIRRAAAEEIRRTGFVSAWKVAENGNLLYLKNGKSRR